MQYIRRRRRHRTVRMCPNKAPPSLLLFLRSTYYITRWEGPFVNKRATLSIVAHIYIRHCGIAPLYISRGGFYCLYIIFISLICLFFICVSKKKKLSTSLILTCLRLMGTNLNLKAMTFRPELQATTFHLKPYINCLREPPQNK